MAVTEVSIKPHTRKSKNGKSYQVKGYTRRVGKKGVHSSKNGKGSTPNAGEEFEQVKEKPYYTTMSAEEIAAWDDAARKASLSYYGSGRGKKKKVVVPPTKKVEKKKEGFLSRLEKKLQRYIKKYK